MELPSVILISPPSYKSGEIELICKFFDEDYEVPSKEAKFFL